MADKRLYSMNSIAGGVQDTDLFYIVRPNGGSPVDYKGQASDIKAYLGLGTLATQSGTFSGTSSGTNTGDQLEFKNVAVSGQATITAKTTADTLTFVAGANIVLTTNASTGAVTITSTASGSGGSSSLAGDTDVAFNTLSNHQALMYDTSTSKWINRTIDYGDIVNAPSLSGYVTSSQLSNYSGSANITTVGTIGTGTWNGTVISASKGGAGTVNGILKADGAGNVSAAVAGTDYPSLSAPTVYTAQQNVAANAITDQATLAWDLNTQQNAKLTLGGNRTMSAPLHMVDGGTYTMRVTQDSTGARTISWNSVFKWSNGVAPSLSTGAGQIDILSFVSDGTYMYGTFAGDFL